MPKRLDLRNDFEEVYGYVVERGKSFDPTTTDGPGDTGPVTCIDFGFGFEQSGWAALVFDTRPDARPDGAWNHYIKGNDLKRPQWSAVSKTNRDESVMFVLPDGTVREVPQSSRDDFAADLGDLLKSVLLKARADGVFDTLPKASRCELGVEEQEGGYGWPAYGDRGKENFV